MLIEILSEETHREFPTAPSTCPEAPGLDRFLSLHDVMRLTSLGKTAIYARISRGQFPRPIPLSRTKVAWSSREIAGWQRDLRNIRRDVAA